MGQRYAHVSLDERCEIYRLHADGKSQRAIGRLMGPLGLDHWPGISTNRLPRAGYKPPWPSAWPGRANAACRRSSA
ncbi:helix-turn-helix domain-containing protein [Magnetospira sp. QH-2]|uniref:helix-turn-helix domain-containing protein n=1 Tax=Magnetospira sp. (strain QH-2) TaxID=1288970 RepID=UPI0009E4D158